MFTNSILWLSLSLSLGGVLTAPFLPAGTLTPPPQERMLERHSSLIVGKFPESSRDEAVGRIHTGCQDQNGDTQFLERTDTSGGEEGTVVSVVIVTFYLGQGCLWDGGGEGLEPGRQEGPPKLPSVLALCKGRHPIVFRQQVALRPA